MTIRIEDMEIEMDTDDDCDPKTFQCYSDSVISDWYNGSWEFVRIIAKCTVSYPIGSHGSLTSRRLEWLTSSGLYGIECHHKVEEYHVEVAEEQLEDLRNHLEVFGVSLGNFNTFARQAIARFEDAARD
jgi:hypothetical protein